MTTAVQASAFSTKHNLLDPKGPVCLIIQAQMGVAAGLDRFQPAGFPEVGHVIYDAPRSDGRSEKVCIVDSPASMANHLEQVCLAGENDPDLHPDLAGLPYVKCVTDRNPTISGGQYVALPDDPRDRAVFTTYTEGHRIASDYFLDAFKLVNGRVADDQTFRDLLRTEFGLVIIKGKKKDAYFIPMEAWWNIYATLFRYDPNSLIHGVLFAKEQIKISRILTAHQEAFGAKRWGRSGIKFDRLQKTTSGQPIFPVDEETASEIRATFIIDLALLRSYGRENGSKSLGLNSKQKALLLGFSLWKISKLLSKTFAYRSGCKLRMESVRVTTDEQKQGDEPLATELPTVDITTLIAEASFPKEPVTQVYYPCDKLFKLGKEKSKESEDEEEDSEADESESED
jgi:CRISPR-associated protein Csb1